tara:strand:- start:3026 stop:3265 length:240 start_codon:yes stop_codon:yes gene_type:complete
MSYSTLGDITGICKSEKHRTKYDKEQLEFFSVNSKDKNIRENFEGSYDDMYKTLSKFSNKDNIYHQPENYYLNRREKFI